MAVTTSSDDFAEGVIIHRLFSASMEIHSALQLVHDGPTTQLLHEAVDRLDAAIKQVRNQAFDQQAAPHQSAHYGRGHDVGAQDPQPAGPALVSDGLRPGTDAAQRLATPAGADAAGFSARAC